MPDVWVPGSKVPFRPVNPWGRPMPKPVRPVREPLYQLIVTRTSETRGKEQIGFGPKMIRAATEQLCEAVQTGIRLGVETELSDPHIVRVLV
jgi:hypothetical protein